MNALMNALGCLGQCWVSGWITLLASMTQNLSGGSTVPHSWWPLWMASSAGDTGQRSLH
jgi:hypothetical protein